ncbi:MAG TPA: Ig-like domain repeat protein, partial [Gemmatimonadales bacterium]|nr:Ig-like domain repeat protein [Gemmatimonadales bacterium]
AASRWVLGPHAGPQRVDARIVGSDQLVASFSATASAGAVASFGIVQGDKQRAPAGATLPDSLVVRALDAQSNPVAGVLVNWTVTGGGSVSTDQVPTGPDGRAAVRRTLGPAAGTQTTVANAGSVPGSPVTFTATAATGTAAALALVTQPASTAQSGTKLSRQPRIQLRDGLGNPVPQAGFTVTAELASGPGATLAGDRTRETDATGVAAFSDLAINGPPGTYTLRFNGTGLPPVVSSAIEVTIGAVSPSRSSLTASPLSIVVSANKSTVTVTVRDEQGNLIGGAAVVPASSDPGTSAFTPANGTTNSSGVATFTFGASAVQSYDISARANNVQLDQKQTIKVTRAPTTTSIRSFQPQSSTALEPVTVGFSVTSSSSGSPSGTVTVTDGSATCSAPVSQGACTLTPTTAGNKTFKATYPGNATFEPSSGTQTHRIDLVPTLVVALTSNQPFGSVVGEPVTFTATVQALNGVANGKVSFRENSCGGSLLGTGTLSGTGDAFLSAATFTTKSLKEGIHSIFACYDGNQTYAGSERGPLAQRVNNNK